MKLRISGLLAIAAFAAAPGQSRAANLTTLVSFCALTNCTDGDTPYAGLIADANGNLFGTTSSGGAYDYGTVFEIAKTHGGYASTPTTLVSFDGFTDGAYPVAVLIADAHGNLFGTTGGGQGGAYDYGTVFEITKTHGGYASTPTTLVSFNFTNGRLPVAGLYADANGNLFGTTQAGGTYDYGTVFEIAKTHGGYASTPTTLVSFNFTDGAFPRTVLIADANGNLFGTTSSGGAYGYGTVFEIAKTHGGYASTPTTLVSFNFTDGATPLAGLIADANGNLFGTTSSGGAYGYIAEGMKFGYGTAFEIAKTYGGYASTPTTLVSFCALTNCTDGAYPYGGLIADANGNLFGTTLGGGAYGIWGTVFEIAKTHGGYASTPTTLVSFDGFTPIDTPANPPAGLIADANGNLFGTAYNGGANHVGAVFEIIGSGFVVPITLAGTPGNPNCFGKSISALARQYGGLNAAAAALGYPSVRGLQDAILEFCES